jgi:hypothetical protein
MALGVYLKNIGGGVAKFNLMNHVHRALLDYLVDLVHLDIRVNQILK